MRNFLSSSDSFGFQAKFLEVDGYKIHYVDEGKGKPLVFIHGNPTWSYQWRNVIPILAAKGFRCVALDLLGFGKSDKPTTVEYTFDLHGSIVNGFIKKLDLRNVVLVVHDWGGSFGLWYALNHPKNVSGVVLLEPLIFPMTWDDYKDERRKRFEMFRDPRVNQEIIQVQNLFVEQISNGVWSKEKKTEEMMQAYRSPFPTPESRRAIRRFAEMLPIGETSETISQFKRIEAALSTFDFPMLLLTVTPGALITREKIILLKNRVRKLTVKELGPGLHHFQEDYPAEIALSISKWISEMKL